MTDIAHVFGNDLQVSPTGDLATVQTGQPETQQRVLHRLLTNLGDYIWWLSYGAGLGKYVGASPPQKTIQGVIANQLALEATVAQNPAPVVTVTPDAVGDLTATVTYADAQSGQSGVLSLPMGALSNA
jgi:hypothetical protein